MKRIIIPTSAVESVKIAVEAIGGSIVRTEKPPGYVGYTRVVVAPAPHATASAG